MKVIVRAVCVCLACVIGGREAGKTEGGKRKVVLHSSFCAQLGFQQSSIFAADQTQ